MLKKQRASEFTTGMEEGLYVVIVLHSSEYECNFQLKKNHRLPFNHELFRDKRNTKIHPTLI